MIRLMVIGHLGNDCTVNESNGRRVLNFSLAHSEKYKDAAGTEINKTVWVSCSYWNERSQISQYLKKGTQVYIEGNADVKMYKNNQGETKANITCRVMNIQLLGGGNRDGNNQHPTSSDTPSQGYGYTPVNSDIPQDDSQDLPF